MIVVVYLICRISTLQMSSFSNFLYRNLVILMINYSSISARMCPKDNTFFLASFKDDCHYKQVCADFSPLPTAQNGRISIMPEFNADHQFYTRGFINPYQKFLDVKKNNRDPQVLTQKQKDIFFKKIQEFESPKTNQNLRFDPQDDSFCSICYQPFEQYWKHVNSRTHRKLIRSSSANLYIHQLCKRYYRNPKSKKTKKLKRNSYKRNSGQELQKMPIENSTCGDVFGIDFLFKPEDFIVKLPLGLFEKERLKENNGTINYSTRVQNSQNKL